MCILWYGVVLFILAHGCVQCSDSGLVVVQMNANGERFGRINHVETVVRTSRETWLHSLYKRCGQYFSDLYLDVMEDFKLKIGVAWIMNLLHSEMDC